jgi:TIR domain
MQSLAERPDLKGFFSYSRRDDEHSQGSLSRLRAQIYNELRLQLGRDFKLFQDTVAIPEGTEWEDEIKRAISGAVFFIPIVTPSSVASIHCRMEFEAFLEREDALGRKNLVFPLLYVQVPALESEEHWRQDPLLGIIGRRQHFDWRKFRHRSFNEAEVAEKIEHFCRRIVESLQQPWASPADLRAAEEAEAQRVAERARLDREEKDRLQAEAEARLKAEQQRLAAAEAEAETQRIVERARRDQEEKDRQQAEAEARRRADEERGAADAAEAQRIADQARKDREKARQQAEAKARQKAEDDRLKQQQTPPPQPVKQSWANKIGLIGLTVFAFCGIAGPIYLVSVLSPAPVAEKPAAPVVQKSGALQSGETPGCMSWRTAASGRDGKNVMMIFDDNPVAEAAAQSAITTARENGYIVSNYARRGPNDADGSSLLGQFKDATVAPDVVFFCGDASPSFMNALKTSKIFR